MANFDFLEKGPRIFSPPQWVEDSIPQVLVGRVVIYKYILE